jgi:DNA-binding beta-propeller fold protein YncE
MRPVLSTSPAVLASILLALTVWPLLGAPVLASYTNFEAGHVHPLALTPSGQRLLVVNTPDALLEIFTVEGNGSLTFMASVPVGLEPVSIGVRSETEAWVVNHLSDSVSLVDLSTATVTRPHRGLRSG